MDDSFEDDLPETPPPVGKNLVKDAGIDDESELPDTPPPMQSNHKEDPYDSFDDELVVVSNSKRKAEDELPATPPPVEVEKNGDPYDSFDDEIVFSAKKKEESSSSSEASDDDDFDTQQAEEFGTSTEEDTVELSDDDGDFVVSQESDSSDDDSRTRKRPLRSCTTNKANLKSSSVKSGSKPAARPTRAAKQLSKVVELDDSDQKEDEEEWSADSVGLASKYPVKKSISTSKVSENQRMLWSKMTEPPQQAVDVLKTFYGHTSFRAKQWDVIRNVLAKRDQFVLMSTGYGKSVCYQLPSLMLNTLTIVISPLISLMHDQVIALRSKGINAIMLSATSPISDWNSVENNVEELRFLYMSPELAETSRGTRVLSSLADYVTLLAIDEAHCVSQWGHDFRSSYRRIAEIRQYLRNVPMMGLTATATVRVQEDVIKNLALMDPMITTTGFDRPNLYISVEKQSSAKMAADFEQLLKEDVRLGRHFGGSTIVYCQTRNMTDEVNKCLKRLGVKCECYHAGRTKKQRDDAHQNFIRDKVTTIVATVAFGMGIDKPDVRNVIHYGSPKDIESYYQEMGRAGRDGAASVCRVYWSAKDFVLNRRRIGDMNTSQEVKDNASKMLWQLEEMFTTTMCRRFQLLRHFDATTPKPVQAKADCCDNCTNMLNKNEDFVASTIDLGTEARWLFSAVHKVYAGKSGMTKAIEFVRGSSKEESRAKNFEQKQLFGVGKALSDKWWKAFGSALRVAGYFTEVRYNNMQFGSCVGLSDKAIEWFNSKTKELKLEASPLLIQGKQPSRGPAKASAASAVPHGQIVVKSSDEKRILNKVRNQVYKSAIDYPELRNATTVIDEDDSKLMADLRVRLDILRTELSVISEIAPFQVAANKVLDGIAAMRPDNMESLAKIAGFPTVQRDLYGPKIVDCVVKFAQETGCKTNISGNEMIPLDVLEKVDRELNPSTAATYRTHLLSAKNIKDLARLKALSEGTCGNHLVTAVEKGLPVHFDVLKINEKLIRLVETATREKCGGDVFRLKPMMEALDEGVIDYERLKIIRAILIYEFGYGNGEKKSDENGSSLPFWMRNTGPTPSLADVASSLMSAPTPPKRKKLNL